MSVHACECGEKRSGFNALKPLRERERGTEERERERERENAWLVESLCFVFVSFHTLGRL